MNVYDLALLGVIMNIHMGKGPLLDLRHNLTYEPQERILGKSCIHAGIWTQTLVLETNVLPTWRRKKEHSPAEYKTAQL